jgi:negative regulator of flagellin synthesis FlgM
MKIDDRIIYYEVSKQLPKSTQNTTELNREKQLPDEQKSAGKAESGQDTIVNLSPALKETQLAKEIIASEPDIREDKVSELKQKIDSGKYTIDYNAVADKLVDSYHKKTSF